MVAIQNNMFIQVMFNSQAISIPSEYHTNKNPVKPKILKLCVYKWYIVIKKVIFHKEFLSTLHLNFSVKIHIIQK
jgi:hypothetical protein